MERDRQSEKVQEREISEEWKWEVAGKSIESLQSQIWEIKERKREEWREEMLSKSKGLNNRNQVSSVCSATSCMGFSYSQWKSVSKLQERNWREIGWSGCHWAEFTEQHSIGTSIFLIAKLRQNALYSENKCRKTDEKKWKFWSSWSKWILFITFLPHVLSQMGNGVGRNTAPFLSFSKLNSKSLICIW